MGLISKKRGYVRAIVKCACAFISLMLFQTSYLRLGTIAASVVAGITVLCFLFSRVRFKIGINEVLILTFSFIVFLNTMIHGINVFNSLAFYVQVLLVLVLASVNVSEKENEYIRKVFTGAAVVYSILIIYSCIVNAEQRYIHDSITLFGTQLDPNFVALPLVASLTLIISEMANRKKKLLCLLIMLIVAFAILYTSSRGAFITAAIIISILLLSFIFSPKVRLSKKMALLFLIVCIVIVLPIVINAFFPEQWERMTFFGIGSDNDRLMLWEKSIKVWMGSPLFGIGLGGVASLYGRATHNTYIQLLAETGFVGFSLFMTFIIRLLMKVRKIDRVLFLAFCGFLFQIAFLDALEDRSFWCMLIWISMLPTVQKQRGLQYEH